MARAIKNLENAFDEMFDFITNLPSGLDGFESDFDSAFEELRELKATLTPPNEWVSRLRELDELYTKLQIVTGFTAEQLLKMFAAGYTLERPDDSKSFEEMASLSETTPPNEPLTLEELRGMVGEPVYDYLGQEWYVIQEYYDHKFTMTDGTAFEDRDELDRVAERFCRRPPEGEEET